MDGFKLLVGAACVAVIGAVGWWGYGELKASQVRAQNEAVAWRAEFDKKREREAETLRQCIEITEAWSLGDKGPAVKLYGDMAEGVIDGCRGTIEIAEIEAREKP